MPIFRPKVSDAYLKIAPIGGSVFYGIHVTSMTERSSIFGLLLLAITIRWSSCLTAENIDIEFLEGEINQASVENLNRLACRNYDHIVHLNISVDWANEAREQETTDYKRLVFWNDNAEYLFPNGSYFWLHRSYVIDGYFIPRRGGMHQGIISVAFDEIDDAQVLLNPSVHELKAKGPGCK